MIFIPPKYLPPRYCEVCKRENFMVFRAEQKAQDEIQYWYTCVGDGNGCTSKLFKKSELEKIIFDSEGVDNF